MMKIAIIGAGAAGLMCAAMLDKTKTDAVIYEKMPRCGVKLSITGKGRCNVTTSTPPNEMEPFINHGAKFLRSALYSFPPEKTVEFFEGNGVKLKLERGGRYFPESDRAKDIVACLEKKASENAEIVYETVKAIEKSGDGFNVIAKSTVYFDKVIIATGGKSYPKTGSDGDGYIFAEKLGHTVTKLSPSLVPLTVKEKICGEMQGLSLKNVAVTVKNPSGKVIYTDFGEMLFTHFGVSGPVILSASSKLSFSHGEEYKLIIDLKPALDYDTLDKRILRDFEETKNRDFINSLSKLLPAKMIPQIVRLSGIESTKKVNSVTKEERERLCKLLKGLVLTVCGTRPIDEAIITSGGINLSEIDSRTMESKITKGLYFAGEIIDADALTGGYNLQIAFSTAKLASNGVLKEIK